MTRETVFKSESRIHLIIGHRGAGKTTWCAEIKKYFQRKKLSVLWLDIDQEIEKKTQQTLNQFFLKGERFFRKLENQTAQECFKKAKNFKGLSFISAGAGFQGDIPSNIHVIHLQRPSDFIGRVFFDRPRIFKKIKPFEEYQKLILKRQPVYQKQRHSIFTRLDYFTSFQNWDKVFFGEPLPFQNGVLTLVENKIPVSEKTFQFFLDQKLKWGLKYFELKDNENSQEFLMKILCYIPLEKILFSFREKKSRLFESFFQKIFSLDFHNIFQKDFGNENFNKFFKNQETFINKSGNRKITADWPIEWGENIFQKKFSNKITWIYSLHHREPCGSFQKVLDQFSKVKEGYLKLAVEVHSLEELWQGHLWQKKDPQRRSFYPRSQEGRWKWYRLLFGQNQLLYFIKEDCFDGVLDQPVMAESVQWSGRNESFACVLGDPIEHSATPYEQEDFFKNKGWPVLKILMKENEMNSRNIKILENLGMKFSAVTSPLKKKTFMLFQGCLKKGSQNKVILKKTVQPAEDTVFKSSKENSLTFLKLQDSPVSSHNTLIWTPKGWCGFNTDIEGARGLKTDIEQYIKKINQQKNPSNNVYKLAVWGGGSVRDILMFVFRETHVFSVSFYSARTGKVIKGREVNPDFVIWAVGRARMSSCLHPPVDWKPQCVFDLHYTEDSPGREYALKIQAEYRSGWKWFQAQALHQRKWFEDLQKDIDKKI